MDWWIQPAATTLRANTKLAQEQPVLTADTGDQGSMWVLCS